MLGERADFRETKRVIAIVFFITAHSSTLEWTLSLSSLRPNNGAHSVVSFRSKWEIQINTNHDEFALVYQVRKWRLCLCRSFPRTLKYSPHWGEITSFAARVKGTWMYRDSKADDRRDRVHMDPKSISQHPALCALVPAGGAHYPKASLPVLLIGILFFFSLPRKYCTWKFLLMFILYANRASLILLQWRGLHFRRVNFLTASKLA